MKNSFVLVGLLCVVFSTATAQNSDPVFLMYNQSVVSYADAAAFDALVDSTLVPVLKSLVEDSLIISWGFTDHGWGDEWNKNWWIIAPNHSAFLAGWTEMISRSSTQYPGAVNEFGKFIKRHKDNLYTINHFNATGPAGGLLVQQFIVSPEKLGAWNNFMKSKSVPIMEKMMQEGLIKSYGNLTHSWGDEWNTGFYMSAETIDKTLAGWREFVSRMNAQHTGWFDEVVQLVDIHKDNMYVIRVQG